MEFIYTSKAEEDLERLPIAIQKRIVHKMRFYAKQPNPLVFAERLTGSATYRFRIGDYRIIFQIEERVLWVLTIRRRDEAYRQ